MNDDISIQADAQKYILSQLNNHPSHIGIRLSIKPSGCAGLTYQLEFIDQVMTDDLVIFITERYALYVDPKAIPFIKGAELQYVTEGLNKRLFIKNPNEVSSCGCGESFSVTEALAKGVD